MPNMTQEHGRSNVDMTNPDVTTVATHWVELTKPLFVTRTETEYQQLVTFLDHLIDKVREDETHPLGS